MKEVIEKIEYNLQQYTFYLLSSICKTILILKSKFKPNWL